MSHPRHPQARGATHPHTTHRSRKVRRLVVGLLFGHPCRVLIGGDNTKVVRRNIEILKDGGLIFSVDKVSAGSGASTALGGEVGKMWKPNKFGGLTLHKT